MLQRLFLAAIAAACLVVLSPSIAPASPQLVSAVRSDLGTNPTGWKRLWCAHYLRTVLKELGYVSAYKKTTAQARSFLKLKRTRAAVGAIAVLKRKGGAHVCTVVRLMKRSFECIGGNQGAKRKDGTRRVSQNTYPMSRVIAFVTP